MSTTFGTYVSARRKELGISQKDLAAKIMREEDGKPISPQYLNDIERDRRQPSSDHMIDQFTNALQAEEDYMYFLAGKLPLDIRQDNPTPEVVVERFKAFRRT